MKKNRILFLPLIIIALFSLNSCGSDEIIDGDLTNIVPNNPGSDGSSSDTSTGLLKKTIDTYPDGTKTTTNYNYNGNKLVSITDDYPEESDLYFTYTGNLITKIEYKFPGGIVDQVNSYTYNADGKIATYIMIDPISKLGKKEVYTYNTDGSVSVIEYIGDDQSQTQADSTSTIKFLNGEVSEITNSNSPNHKYLYDTKNNPTKNVLGWNKIEFGAGESGGGILHNEISDTYGTRVWTNTYTYNSNGYPETSIETDADGEKTTTQYFY
jgi:hypothetical protein